MRIFFLQRSCRIIDTENSFRALFVFLKSFLLVKANDQHPSFNIFDTSRPGHAIKTNYMNLKTVDPNSCSLLFFLKKGSGNFSQHFVQHFSTKIFLIIY